MTFVWSMSVSETQRSASDKPVTRVHIWVALSPDMKGKVVARLMTVTVKPAMTLALEPERTPLNPDFQVGLSRATSFSANQGLAHGLR
jgi:hypothetical protein